MPIWISRAFSVTAPITALALLLGLASAQAKVIEQLPTTDKLVALTFDACESKTPAFLDTRISDYLVAHQLPFTIFASGRFAQRNAAALGRLAKLDFVEIENHSLSHDNHMDRMNSAAVIREVTENDAILAAITGRHSRYFRFPAGNYGPQALADVEGLGYKVVHWSFASGDPAKSLAPTALRNWVLLKTKPGNILIFHINGRGWSTGAALPGIIDELTRRGYRFTTLDQILP